MIRRMDLGDLDQIADYEKAIFTSPWKREDYEYELKNNPFARYYVCEVDGKIAAYGGVWITFEQAQITNLAVVPEYRRHGLGQQMIDILTNTAVQEGCETISLEVRRSNDQAIRLYERNGFVTINVRKGYYADDHEDALFMMKAIGGME